MSLVETLKKASENLLMSSEADYPFKVFHWKDQSELTPENLLKLANHPQETPVEIVDLTYLFRNVAQEKEWHDDAQKANVSKFQALVKTLKENLQDIKVYRVGTTNIDVYIAGKSEDGLAGLSTKLVET